MTADRSYRNERRIKSSWDGGSAMTRIRNYFRATLVLGIAISICAAGAHAQRNAPHIALKSGESVDLRNFFFVVNCQSVVIGTPLVKVLEGPDQLTISFRKEMVLPRAQNCAKPVPGGIVVATAGDVKEPVEAKLTFRLKYNTKMGERQGSNTYIVSLYPGGARTGDAAHTPPTNPTESMPAASPQ
jgi:hypothetical protein